MMAEPPDNRTGPPAPAVSAPAEAVDHSAAQPRRVGAIARWEIVVWVVLILASAALRLWDLGGRAYQYDESLHASTAWNLYRHWNYQHAPMMHGPFQFYGTALMFFLFGDSDYTGRLLYALFGIALVGLPFFWRRELGRAGALAAAGLIAISPMLLYYSRFARNESPISVWNLALAICMWCYLQGRRPRYLYLGALFLALAFATKETAYITAAIFGTFLLLMGGWDLLRWVRHGFRHVMLSPAAEFFLMMASLLLPLAAAATTLPARWLGVDLSRPIGEAGVIDAKVGGAALVTLGFFALTAALGLVWNRRLWVRCFAIFYGVFLVMYTSLFTWLPGFGSGVWGSLDYWLLQQGVRRGGQPEYYYLIVMPIYEFLPLILTFFGWMAFWNRRNPFDQFLIYWAGMSLILYSLGGERMPWLSVHIVLPMALLGGRWLGERLERVDWRSLARRETAYMALFGLLLLLGAGALVRAGPRGVGQLIPGTSLVLVFIVALLAGATVYCSLRLGRRRALTVGSLALLGILAVLTLRASWLASFRQGDVPVEMITYAQGSNEVPPIMESVDRVARQTGKGYDLPLVVDRDIYWGMVWYLRRYKNVEYATISGMTAPKEGAVLLMDVGNEASAQPFLENYGPRVRFLYLWWPAEGYKTLTPQRLLDSVTSGRKWLDMGLYFLHRKTEVSFALHQAVAYFPKGYPVP
ncbi:MAG: TIGR03663 family protein [Chloroflexi bacterium]|nr:TIGR03663 family protein [Chloroflexota bacterium]